MTKFTLTEDRDLNKEKRINITYVPLYIFFRANIYRKLSLYLLPVSSGILTLYSFFSKVAKI